MSSSVSNIEYKRIRVVVSLFFFVQGFIFATWASRIPDIKSAMGLNEAALGSILFAIPVGQISAMAFSAYAVKRWSSFRTLSIASILTPAGLIPLGLATSPFVLALGLYFFGAATNLYNISVNTQGVDVERSYDKNIMSSFHGMWSLGGFMGGLTSMACAAMSVAPLQHFAMVCVSVLIITSVFKSRLLREDVKPMERKEDLETIKRPLYKRLDTYILLLGVMAFGALVCEGTMYDWSGVYFADIVEAPDNLIRLGYIVCMCAMTLGRFMGDRLKSRFGTVAVVRGSGLLIAAGLLLSATLPTLIFATFGFMLIGFGISSTMPVCYSLAGRSTKMSPSVALASVSTIGYLGFLLGPPVIGFVAEAITLRWTFALIASIGLGIAIISGQLKKYI